MMQFSPLIAQATGMLEKIEDPILADLGDQLGAMLFILTRKDHFTKSLPCTDAGAVPGSVPGT